MKYRCQVFLFALTLVPPAAFPASPSTGARVAPSATHEAERTNTPPTARLTASSHEGNADILIQFDGSPSVDSESDKLRYQWKVNGRDFASDVRADYLFEEAGRYTVELTVTDEQGMSDQTSTRIQITETHQRPSAVMQLGGLEKPLPLTLEMNARNSVDVDGTIIRYEWFLNDRKISDSLAATQTISDPGTYKLSLRTTDDLGRSNTSTVVFQPREATDSEPANDRKPQQPIKALLVTGGAFHDFDAQAGILMQGLSQRLNLEWHVANEARKTDRRMAVYHADNWAEPYDIILHNECTADLRDKAWTVGKIIAGHVRSKTPAVNIHCTMHSFGQLDDITQEWRKFLGVTSPTHEITHTPLQITRADDHPITVPLGRGWVSPSEELYIINKVWPKAKVLATAPSVEKPGADYAVFWTNQYQGVKIFGTSLGHFSETLEQDAWLDTVANGLLWATGHLERP